MTAKVTYVTAKVMYMTAKVTYMTAKVTQYRGQKKESARCVCRTDSFGL